MSSKYLTARSLTFFDDGETAKLSIATVEDGHHYIKITACQAALLIAELGTYNFAQMNKAAKEVPIE
jgi:hypothetical protein